MADRPLCAPHVAPIPMLRRGQVQIINLGDTSKAGQIIDAHVTGLACISLNRQGTMLATASEKGTLLRVFDTRTSKQLFELRRGSTSVTITRFARKLLRSIAAFLALLCSRRRALLTLATGLLSGLVWICTTTCSINFSSDSSKIVVSSDKTTVHIFNLAGGASADGKKPANSGMMPTYFRCVRVWSTLVRLYKRSRHRFHRRFLGRRRRHGITPVLPPPRPPPPEGSCNHCITQPNRPSPLPTIVAASHNPTLSLSPFVPPGLQLDLELCQVLGRVPEARVFVCGGWQGGLRHLHGRLVLPLHVHHKGRDGDHDIELLGAAAGSDVTCAVVAPC